MHCCIVYLSYIYSIFILYLLYVVDRERYGILCFEIFFVILRVKMLIVDS